MVIIGSATTIDMDASSFQPLIQWLASHPHWVAVTLFLVAFVESLVLAGIIVPGVLLLFLVAAVAGNGTLSLGLSMLMAFLGAVAGDGISFWIGHRFKHQIVNRWPFTRYPKAIAYGEQYFLRHGGKSVMLGRFIGPLRPIMPLVAGMLNMRPAQFLLYNVSSALAWAPAYIIPGYFAGASVKTQLPLHFYSTLGVLAAILLLFTLLFRLFSLHLQRDGIWYRYLEKRAEDGLWSKTFWQSLTRYQDHPSEFPLPSITLFISASMAFLICSWLVTRGEFQFLDQLVMALFYGLRNEVTDPLMINFTLLANPGLLTLAFAIFIGMFITKKDYVSATHLLIAGIATSLLSHGLKDWFALPRPDLVVRPPVSFSFPSGHSSGATVFFGLFASFIAQEVNSQLRWKIYLGAAVPIFLVATSRLYLGVHWLSDVLGGIALGLIICGLTRISLSRHSRPPLRLDRLTLAGIVLWLTGAAVYLATHYHQAAINYQVLPTMS